MKRIAVFFAALLLWGGVARADLVVSAGQNELRLFSSPCVHGGVLGLLKEEFRPQFRKAQASVEGKTIFACWIDAGDGYYFVFFETGYAAAYSITAFTEQPGT